MLGGGVIATAWQDLLARVIPLERRGRFLGLSFALGAGFGLAGAALSAWLLVRYAFPANFAYLFMLGAIALTIGWLFLSLVREPPHPVAAKPQSQRQFFRSLPELLRQDPRFRRFLGARSLLAMAGMGLGFITVAAVRRWNVSDGTVGIYTAAQLLGQIVGNLVFPMLADRHGHKPSLEWSSALFGVAFALTWLVPTATWYYLVFFLVGVSQGATTISGILVVMEFCEPQRRPTYMGIANTGVGLVSMLGPLLAAWLADVHFGLLFALSAAISFLAWAAMHWWVEDPRSVASVSNIP
jgi:MFS family permease